MSSSAPPVPPLDGAVLILRERVRQVVSEGWTPESDAAHAGAELAWASWAYLDRALHDRLDDPEPPAMYPWEPESWKPGKTPLRALVVAGALIAAEVDRRLAAGERP